MEEYKEQKILAGVDNDTEMFLTTGAIFTSEHTCPVAVESGLVVTLKLENQHGPPNPDVLIIQYQMF